MIRGVLFDLDETLIDRTTTINLFLQEQYSKFQVINQVIEFSTFQKHFLEFDRFGYGPKSILYERLVSDFGLDILPERLISDFSDNGWKHCVLFDRVPELLRELRYKGYKIGIITNGASKVQEDKICLTKLDHLIDAYLISGKEKVKKPNPTIFQSAVERLGLVVSECVFIGDNPKSDIVGAKNAGIKAIWFRRNLEWSQDIEVEADYIIEEFEDLFDLDMQALA